MPIHAISVLLVLVFREQFAYNVHQIVSHVLMEYADNALQGMAFHQVNASNVQSIITQVELNNVKTVQLMLTPP